MDYLTIANSPVFWGLCGITVLISLAQALLFMRQAKKAAEEASQNPETVAKKKMSIAERAHLAENLDDAPEEKDEK